MAIISLGEARAQLQIRDSDTSLNAIIQAYCDGLTPVIEEKANKVIDRRTITEDYDLTDPHAASVYSAGFAWTDMLWLRNRPVIALTSITNVDNGFTWVVGNMHVRPDGRLRVKSGPGLYGYLTIVYDAGYATIPANYKQAALIILQHTWESRRGIGPAGVMGLGEQISPDSYSIPPKAYEWLGSPEPGGP